LLDEAMNHRQAEAQFLGGEKRLEYPTFRPLSMPQPLSLNASRMYRPGVTSAWERQFVSSRTTLPVSIVICLLEAWHHDQ
jgi:hypothetical protein